MPRDTFILPQKELFEKTSDIVEHAVNAQIKIDYGKGNNFCRYNGKSKNTKDLFTIHLANPPVKHITQYTALLHELGHILYESPFEEIKEHFKNSKNYVLYYAVFNILEDQRIESHLSKNYISYGKKFEKSLMGLGNDLDGQINDPTYVLLAIRFMQDELVKNAKNYVHFKKAMSDVKNTSRTGAIVVFYSIKKYLQDIMLEDEQYTEDYHESTSKEDKTVTDDLWTHGKITAFFDSRKDEINKMKNVDERLEEFEKLSEFLIEKTTQIEAKKQEVQQILDKHSSKKFPIPPELLKENFSDEEINTLLKKIKTDGQKQHQEVRNKILGTDYTYDNTPEKVIKIQRVEEKYTIDDKTASKLNRLFKIFKMRDKSFTDYVGQEIDVEKYIENVIQGTDINKSFENTKKSSGVSIIISIDVSSSMTGTPIKTARKLVATLFQSLKGITDVEIRGNVWAGNSKGYIAVTEINNMNDVKKISTKSIGSNYYSTPTHMAFEYSSKMLKEMKHERKLLIIITDGCPNHFTNEYHIPWGAYLKTCKKSFLKTMSITPNIMCVVVQDKESYKHNFMKEIFKQNKIIRVDNMNMASTKVINQFKNFIQYETNGLF